MRFREFDVAAADLTTMLGAWEAIQGQHLRDELTLQNGAMIMERRRPASNFLTAPA